MTLLSCFECSFSTQSVDKLESHLWKSHHDGEDQCSECGLPVRRETFSYHFPGLFGVDKVGLFSGQAEFLCPICGTDLKSSQDLRNHLQSHSSYEQRSYLGGSQICDYCGEKLTVGEFDEHLDCLLTATENESPGQPEVDCALSTCSKQFETKGNALWHIWLTHLTQNGISGECPGCDHRIQFGELLSHLGCLEDVDPKAASALLPDSETTCLLCGLSVYSTDVLHRHYHKNHVSSRRLCPGCGERFTEEEGADVLDHIVCLGTVNGDTNALSHIDQTWYCPVCSAACNSQTDFYGHLGEAHTSLIAGGSECAICEESVANVESHQECLVSSGRIQDVIGSIRSDQKSHSPQNSVDAGAYFGELNDFISLEIDAERDEGWERYKEQSLEALVNQGFAIPHLIHVGEDYHPEFEHQLIYQHADAGGDNTREIDLYEEYGVHVGNEVIVGGVDDDDLPREGVVTFIDDASIGIAFRPEHRSVTDRLLQQLSRDDATYHCVELANPLEYQRKRTAIQQVRKNSRFRSLVLGETTITERAVRITDSLAGNLNEYQKSAVERALGTDEVLCIHGPPGTGKTRTLVRLIRLAIARGDRVLATSHSNQAVDNLIAGNSTLTSPDEDSLHYVGSPAGGRRNPPPRLQRKLEENPEDEKVQKKIRNIRNRPNEISIARVGGNSYSEVINHEYSGGDVNDADLVAGTMSSLSELDAQSQFDLVVVDEAGQAAQPSSFIPLLRGDRIVLAGDHLQLPPYAADESAKEEDMHISLFEHLLNAYGPSISVMLQRQYRMNEAIAEFPNKHIYDGQLTSGEMNQSWTIDDLKPIMGVDVQGDEQTRETSHSKLNPEEAEIVANHVKLLQMSDVSLSDIGVITPYTAQIGAIQSAVRDKTGTARDLKIDTVDSFQGSEREAIIVSFVRSNSGNHTGFLALPEEGKRRLNVSLTRAKKRLVLIGDWNTLGSLAEYEDAEESSSNLYAALYKELDQDGLIKRRE